MTVQIKNVYTGGVICEASTLEEAVVANKGKLIHADLRGKDLRGFYLRGADLRYANLTSANLQGTDVRDACLVGANLRKANMTSARLFDTNLTGADLQGTNLHRADLSVATLKRANLIFTNLSYANLTRVNIRRTDLRETNLTGVRMSWLSHDLIGERLRRAAEGDLEKLKVAAFISNTYDFCWEEFMLLNDPLKDWALETMVGWIHEDDDDEAPSYVLEAKERMETRAAADCSVTICATFTGGN